MADVAAGSDFQLMQHMMRVSNWNHAGVVRQIVVKAQTRFPKRGRALATDESGFAKKGGCLADVARQWNGLG